MNKLATSQNLFKHIKNLIEQTKQTVAVAVNSSMTLRYWNIGKTINDEINKNESSSDNIIVEKTQTESEIKKGFEIVSAKKPSKLSKWIKTEASKDQACPSP